MDVTSDGLSQESYVSIDQDSLLVNQDKVSEKALIRDGDGQIKGIMLGEIDSEKRYSIKMDYSAPEDLSIQDDQKLVLVVELISRQVHKKSEDS